MTNPSLLLSAASRPATTSNAASSTAAKPFDDASASSTPRFDAAMDAARAHARSTTSATSGKTATAANASGKDKTASQTKDKPSDTRDADDATPAKAPVKEAAKADDPTAKKEDAGKDDDDTSIASSVLALIGVPPKVTDLAGKALKGAASLAGGTIGDAIGSLLPGAADKDGLAAMTGSAATATGPAVVAPFATLMAAQGIDATAKDDAPVKDVTSLSPMPYSHGQGANAVEGPAVQVQATQAAASPAFTQELGEQIAWMGSGEIKEARIKLHPEELGSMDVRVNLDGGKVNVAIIAQHPAAVHAVQQTLSQLDTLLAHHGLSLGQASVGQGSAGQAGSGQGSSAGQGDASSGDGSNDTSVLATSRVSRGLVDEVA